MAEAWLDQLKKQISDVQPSPPAPQVQVNHKHKDAITLGLAAFVAILFVCIGLMVFTKPTAPTEGSLNWHSLTADQKADWLFHYTAIHNDKITLLGVVANNNTNLAKANSKWYKDMYVYLNADWTLDRMPKAVNWSQTPEDTKALVQKYYRH